MNKFLSLKNLIFHSVSHQKKKKKKKKKKKVVKQNTRHASEWIFQDVSISLKAEYLIQSFRDFLKIFV